MRINVIFISCSFIFQKNYKSMKMLTKKLMTLYRQLNRMYAILEFGLTNFV